MAERQTRREAAEGDAPATETTDNASAAHAVAGRLQAGEAGETTSTRVPRGVGEPAADAKAEHDGVAALQEHVFAQVNAEVAQGFRGQQVDSTPNEAYTLRGVGRGDKTPETVVYTPKGR